MRSTAKLLVGIGLGVGLAWLVNAGVSLAPTRLPEPEPVTYRTGRPEPGNGVRVSFVTTGTARTPGRRLQHGAGLGSRDVAFRAALIEHPRGLVLFGTGVDPDGPDGLVYDPFGPIETTELPAELPQIARAFAPTPRWIHLGGMERWPAIEGVRVEIGSGDFWQVRRGPWPRRYGMERERFARVSDHVVGIGWGRSGHMGFAKSLDVFGDGSLVIVGLRGSTIDELGALVTLDSGRRLLLVGDAVWTLDQVGYLYPRPPWSTWFLDRNRMQLAGTQTHLFGLWRDHGVRTVPLLDGELDLPEYPQWWQ